MKNFLITGGSGNLGKELKKYLPHEAPNSKILDVRDTKTVYRYKFTNFTSVVHCAAYTNVPAAEQDKKIAIETNILGTRNIAETFKNIRIVYISTDYVYAGQKGNYTEEDQAKPFNFYGFTKLAAEQYMSPHKDLIIRTSFKPNEPWRYPSAFDDLYTSADYVDVVAKQIINLIDSDIIGVVNVGTEKKSVFDLAKRRNEKIIASSVKSVYNVSMPKDISMNLTKYNKLKEERKWE